MRSLPISSAVAGRYDGVAKTLHWLSFGLVAVQFAIGWNMPEIGVGRRPSVLIEIHMSIGIAILVITGIRLAWRLGRGAPPGTIWRGVGASNGKGRAGRALSPAFLDAVVGLGRCVSAGVDDRRLRNSAIAFDRSDWWDACLRRAAQFGRLRIARSHRLACDGSALSPRRATRSRAIAHDRVSGLMASGAALPGPMPNPESPLHRRLR